jgi:hypothetical protein
MVARRADAVFYNGRIYTFDSESRIVKALAVSDGVVIAFGDDSDIKKTAPRGCDKFDLGGRSVVPGFIDAHTHFVQMGLDMLSVDLSGTTTLGEAMALMRAASQKISEDEWVIGTCWRESSWKDGRFITRADLDQCCPDRKTVAHRICGHLSSVNSKAISALGIDGGTPDVDKDSSGLTGILKESAVGLVRAATAPSRQRMAKALTIATKKAHSLGVTSVHDNARIEDLPVYQEAERSGKLKVRVRFNMPSDNLESLLDLRMSSGLGSHWLRIGGLKIFCDGALGARTAALSEPFTDDPGNKGMFVHDAGRMDEMVSKAHEAGIQVVIHAIGDEGIGRALASVDAALTSLPRKDHRHRIEHLELPSRDHLKQMRRLGVIASMQPNFVGEWGGINGMYTARLGPERSKRNNPFKEMLDARVRLAFGSDCMPFSPLYGILSAVNAPYEAQRLGAADAIRAYTLGSAYAGFDEGVKGSLEVGKLADFAVLSSDPITVPSALPSTMVVKTVIDGELVFDRSGGKGA